MYNIMCNALRLEPSDGNYCPNMGLGFRGRTRTENDVNCSPLPNVSCLFWLKIMQSFSLHYKADCRVHILATVLVQVPNTVNDPMIKSF